MDLIITQKTIETMSDSSTKSSTGEHENYDPLVGMLHSASKSPAAYSDQSSLIRAGSSNEKTNSYSDVRLPSRKFDIEMLRHFKDL